MSINQKVRELYKNQTMKMYASGILGMFLGFKICDLIFYDPMKH